MDELCDYDSCGRRGHPTAELWKSLWVLMDRTRFIRSSGISCTGLSSLPPAELIRTAEARLAKSIRALILAAEKSPPPKPQSLATDSLRPAAWALLQVNTKSSASRPPRRKGDESGGAELPGPGMRRTRCWGQMRRNYSPVARAPRRQTPAKK